MDRFDDSQLFERSSVFRGGRFSRPDEPRTRSASDTLLAEKAVQAGRRPRQTFEAPGDEDLRMQAVGRLAAEVAHDFNNLLSVILSYAGELEMALEDPELKGPASEIRSAAQRGADLTRQLLTHGRRDDIAGEPLGPNRCIREASGLLHRALGEGFRLNLELADGLPQTMLSPGQAERVLVNLAVNARDAMPSGGEVTIATELVVVSSADTSLSPGWYVQISVGDHGMGMDPAIARRAVEPFFTTKEPGEGTGLGLATVNGIVRGAGGDVRISSIRDEGTTVSLLLPAVREDGEPLSLRS